MRPQKPTLYIRPTKQPYLKVEFGRDKKPLVPHEYEGRFYVRLSENGKRRWKPFGALDEALTELENRKTNLERSRLGLPLVPTEPAPDSTNKTIADAVEEFIAYSESRISDWQNGAVNGLSPRSVEGYKKSIEDFAASCTALGAVYMSEFENPTRGEAIILNFKNWLHNAKNVTRKHGKGAYTDRLRFIVLGQFLSRNGIKMKTDRTFNPNDTGLVDHVDVPRVKKPTIADAVYYTPSDIKAMLAAADDVDPKVSTYYFADDLKDLVFLLLCTGMRDEEAQHLCWSDIQWANGASGQSKMKITVQDKPQYHWRVKDHEKRVVVPDKNAMLQARLKARQDGKGDRAKRYASELLFPNSQGTPNQHLGLRIESLQSQAESNGYVFSRPEARTHILHTFRKSYATYQMLQGVPARNIQRDLGHSELNTTERYLAVVDEPAAALKAYNAIK